MRTLLYSVTWDCKEATIVRNNIVCRRYPSKEFKQFIRTNKLELELSGKTRYNNRWGLIFQTDTRPERHYWR